MTGASEETKGTAKGSEGGGAKVQENKGGGGRMRDRRDRYQPPTKVVVRRLPPSMTQETFVEQVSPLAENDYMYFVRADLNLGPFAYSRAYINFRHQEDIFVFRDKFDGYVFVDSKNGGEYPAVVEFAPFQKVPRAAHNSGQRKRDAKCATIQNDPDYIQFLATLQAPEEVSLPSAEMYLEEIETRERELRANNGVPKITTPLIEFIKQKKLERQRLKEEKREERKRREIERKRQKEEERLRRKELLKEKEAKERDKRDKKAAAAASSDGGEKKDAAPGKEGREEKAAFVKTQPPVSQSLTLQSMAASSLATSSSATAPSVNKPTSIIKSSRVTILKRPPRAEILNEEPQKKKKERVERRWKEKDKIRRKVEVVHEPRLPLPSFHSSQPASSRSQPSFSKRESHSQGVLFCPILLKNPDRGKEKEEKASGPAESKDRDKEEKRTTGERDRDRFRRREEERQQQPQRQREARSGKDRRERGGDRQHSRQQQDDWHPRERGSGRGNWGKGKGASDSRPAKKQYHREEEQHRNHPKEKCEEEHVEDEGEEKKGDRKEERKEKERGPSRGDKRIRNKDRPSMEIYRPGMGRLSSQRKEKEEKDGDRSDGKDGRKEGSPSGGEQEEAGEEVEPPAKEEAEGGAKGKSGRKEWSRREGKGRGSIDKEKDEAIEVRSMTFKRSVSREQP